MTVEVLIATMHQNDHSLVERMNVSTNALVGNQCDRNEVEEFTYRGKRIRYYSFAEVGVGLNRNTILMRSSADICVLADDDMVFLDGYEEKIIQAFQRVPDADILCLNIVEERKIRPVNKKIQRVRWYNYGRYGAARIALKREPVLREGVCFNLSFGGGAQYSQGEDTLFLYDCLKKGLHIYAVPVELAQLLECRESTWFKGYTPKFFYDKGVYLSCLHSPISWVLGLRYCIKYRKRYVDQFSWLKAYAYLLDGMKHRKQCCL